MSLMLNITNDSTHRGASKQKTAGKTKGMGPDSSDGFSFDFVKSANVKPIIARRRPAKRAAVQSTATDETSPSAKLSKPVFVRRNESPEMPERTNDFVQSTDSFSLNIFSDPSKIVIKEKKKSSQRPDNSVTGKKAIPVAPISQADPVPSSNVVDFSDEYGQVTMNPTVKLPIESKLDVERVGTRPKVMAKPRENLPHRPPKISQRSLFEDTAEIPKIGQRLVKPTTEVVFTGAPVSSLPLHAHCVKNLADVLEITELTNVQQRTIPVVLGGRDVLVRSQTGSGKTLAYALPIVERLQAARPKLTRTDGIRAVIVVPTRELALQSFELFVKLVKPFTWLIPGYLTGGEKRKAEKARLRKGINILVGTPGRLCDHLLHTESFQLNKVEWLVLDEADKLLEFGYERDVRKIVDSINGRDVEATAQPVNEQSRFERAKKIVFEREAVAVAVDGPHEKASLLTILLSATLTPAVEKLAGLTLCDPLFIDTSDIPTGGHTTKTVHTDFAVAVAEAVQDETIVIPATIAQTYMVVPPKLRLVVLAGLVARECVGTPAKLLVFMATQEQVEFHHDLMVEALTRKILDADDEEMAAENGEDTEEGVLDGVRFFKLHGAMTQQERSAVFKAFRQAKTGVLLSTDVAGRGIDVPKVDAVVQFSPPQKISDYVHRAGRTARAGRHGKAILILAPSEIEFVRVLEGKNIRISQEDFKVALVALKAAAGNINHRTTEDTAVDVQHKFENAVADDREMHERACKAFSSWVRFYSAFPRELRHIFNLKSIHMGHYAKSVGLHEPPKSFTRKHSTPKIAHPTNRLTFNSTATDAVGMREKRPMKLLNVARDMDTVGGDMLHKSKLTGDNEPQLRQPTVRNANTVTDRMSKLAAKTICLSTSEFGSGLTTTGKRRR